MALYVDIIKQLGDFTLNVKFSTDKGITALFGVSGSGKSITLKCIAGIIKPDKGTIVLNDKVLFDSEKRINLPPQKRNIGMLFQQYALFPDMTVKENIMSGLHKHKKSQRDAKALKLIKKYRLENISNLYPRQISGGQQQRVALARAMATKPELLLLDEPFSALDSHLKSQLEIELLDALKEFDGDVMFVSHSKEEVYSLCDNVCVIDNGICDSVRDTKAVFEKPQSVADAILLGVDNIIPDNKIAFYADAVRISDDDTDFTLNVKVKHIIEETDATYLILSVDGHSEYVKMKIDNGSSFTVGEALKIGFNRNDIIYLK